MAGKKRAKPKRPLPPSQRRGVQVYTLEVVLIRGPFTEEFDRANPEVSRTLALRGDQTLADLHWAIFDAFDRDDEHLYEFQFGDEPMDPRARTYGTAVDREFTLDLGGRVAKPADHARLDDVGLIVGLNFFYWFDFGDDWWHRIQVLAIDDAVPGGDYPREIRRVGASPPQYLYDEDEDEDEDLDEDEDDLEDDDPDVPEGLHDEDLMQEAEVLKREFPELLQGDVLDLLDENLLEEADELLRKQHPDPRDEEDDDGDGGGHAVGSRKPETT
jgi:hypothetical protein